MHTGNRIMALVVGWLMVLSSGLVCAQSSWSFPDFSAKQVFPSQRADIVMKVYRSGSSVRLERSAAIATVYVPSSSKTYSLTVYPDQSRQCVSMNPEQDRMLPSPLELIQGKILKRTVIGAEVVEGHHTKVESVVVMEPDGKKVVSKVWGARDLKGIPVKIESQINHVTLTAVYRDIVVGAPDKALFTIPDRCTPFEKMGQVAEALVLK